MIKHLGFTYESSVDCFFQSLLLRVDLRHFQGTYATYLSKDSL